ncbi:MAG: DUF167 domain-containing protein [Desulfovibrionaceae bacterium]|nr:DUF167 domain-containing protein [Desulfovibrionaceae bacterium]MDD4951167.1 DUF167 domain-containing protein [Desulfovibrionaceae bacterium]
MDGLPGFVRPAGPGRWRLDVWVQPGAKEDGPAGLYRDRPKIRLRARAVDNKANKSLVALVAGLLGLRPGQVALDKGQTGRMKTLIIESDTDPRWDAVVPEGEA